MTVIGIDFGTRRIGLAVCHDGTSVAVKAGIIDARDSLKKQFAQIIEKYNPELFVIGDPLDLHGNPGPMSEKTSRFAAKIESWFNIKCELWDERYTSAQADFAAELFREKGDRDQASAVLILQSYLDSKA